LGRRRRKVIRIPKKKLPKVFDCLKCGQKAIRVEIIRSEQRAILRCGNCKFKTELPVLKQAYGEIDIYNQFVDQQYAKSTSTASTTTPTTTATATEPEQGQT